MKVTESPTITDSDAAWIRRFWKKVKKSKADDCWPWTAAKTEHGYGRFGLKKKSWVAPRLAWIISNGRVPKDKFVLHSCDNPPCCNPAHLFIGTQKDNMRDAIKKGRWTPKHARKLNPSQVLRIRRLYKNTELTQDEIGLLYGVSAGAIHSIVKNKTWLKEWGHRKNGRKIK